MKIKGKKSIYPVRYIELDFYKVCQGINKTASVVIHIF